MLPRGCWGGCSCPVRFSKGRVTVQLNYCCFRSSSHAAGCAPLHVLLAVRPALQLRRRQGLMSQPAC
jgi:hypothetical protein